MIMLTLHLACALLPLLPIHPPLSPLAPSLASATLQSFAKLSPFQAVRQKGEHYEVRFEGIWYRLVRLDGLSAASIREFCDKRWGSRSEKRFAEDLVEVLAGMNHETTGVVSLELMNLATEEIVKHAAVKMTESNRRMVWLARKDAEGQGSGRAATTAVSRVTRQHSSTPAEPFAFLAAPLEWEGWTDSPSLSREAAEQDLDQLEWSVQNTYSYRDLNGVNTEQAFDAVRAGLKDKNPLGAFATRASQLLALYGDGHTRVRGVESHRPTGYLPFLMEWTPEGVLAFHPDRSRFLDDEFRYLAAIDGQPLDAWLAVAGRAVAHGSEQFVRRYSLRDLRLINAMRTELGLPLTSELDVLLRNSEGEERALVLPLAKRKPGYGPWPRPSAHRVLEGNIGYLCVPSMDSDPEFIGGLERAMEDFRKTAGLVIDVRENGGGSRDALRLLLPYILNPKAGPRVVNVGAYRMPEGEKQVAGRSYLENRSMFPTDASSWSKQERKAISKASSKFKPDWTPAAEDFSDWHYLLISSGGAYHYKRPVVVLMDGGCFSATDIFLGAFHGVPGVTLMGTPSGGGSGRSQSIGLANSGLQVRLSSMASFRPDGSRYDGKGVAPDVLVLPEPESFLANGIDNVLQAALDQF